MTRTHGHARENNNSPEYRSHQAAKRRCTNPNSKDWKNYGGRGIQFLFTSFEQFFAELGLRPKGFTLERIDNGGNYEPGNVRWATPEEQMANRRPSVRKNCTSGISGVSWNKKMGKYAAYKCIAGKHLFFGYFAIKEEAAAALASKPRSRTLKSGDNS